jgi:hypothetical protein
LSFLVSSLFGPLPGVLEKDLLFSIPVAVLDINYYKAFLKKKKTLPVKNIKKCLRIPLCGQKSFTQKIKSGTIIWINRSLTLYK